MKRIFLNRYAMVAVVCAAVVLGLNLLSGEFKAFPFIVLLSIVGFIFAIAALSKRNNLPRMNLFGIVVCWIVILSVLFVSLFPFIAAFIIAMGM